MNACNLFAIWRHPMRFGLSWPGLPVLLLTLLPAWALGQLNYTPYTFTTLAGMAGSAGNTDGAGSAARFNQPLGIAVDNVGNLYVADTANHTIRQITPAGVVSTLAGLAGTSGSADGTGSAARFYQPSGLAVDSVGNLFVADTGNHAIREISPDGAVTTLAGSAGDPGYVDGAIVTSRFNRPSDVAVDAADNVYVIDLGNQKVRKIMPSGLVTTLAFYLFRPEIGGALAADAAGNVYLSDPAASSAWGLAKITPSGARVTVGMYLFDTPPGGLAVDVAGNLYVADPEGTIYRFAFPLDGVPSLIAGALYDYWGGPGANYADGTGKAARFNGPAGIAVDTAGHIYVADAGNNVIRKGEPYPLPIITADPADRTVTAGQNAAFSVDAGSSFPASLQWQHQPAGSTTWTDLNDDATYSGTTTANLTLHPATAAANGDSFRCVITNVNGTVISAPATVTVVVSPPLTVRTFAGLAGTRGNVDGPGSAARFFLPTDVAVDSAGSVYVADTANGTIRKITPDATVTTLTGAGRFANPCGVGVDRVGNVYVSETDASVIRKITPDGMVTTLAGLANTPGSADGTGTAARFNGPSGIVADAAGNLYVADTLNGTIRKIASDGTVTTTGGPVGMPSPFSGPQGLVLDNSGSLYIAGTNSNTIQQLVLSTGTLTRAAGFSGIGSDDGPAAAAQFHFPSGVAVDGAGNLYVADTDNNTIRQITPAGVVSTIAGLVGVSGSADGVGTAARFNYLTGIAADEAGNLYIADTDNHTIRLAYFAAAPAITSQPQSQSVTAGANVQFSVTVTGKPAPACQWYFNGAAINGATSRALSLSDVQPANAGSYTVTVTNDSGSATSNAATLTVNAATTGTSPSNGGGAMDAWLVLALLALGGARGVAAGIHFLLTRVAGSSFPAAIRCDEQS